MHDALLDIGDIKQRNAEVTAIGTQRLHLLARYGVSYDLGTSLVGGKVVVNGRDCEFRAAHLSPCNPQAFKGLRRCHLVN